MKVLIVQDDFLLANFMRDILEYAGHQVLPPCLNYTESIISYSENFPDIVLMDIDLKKDKTAFKAAFRMKELRPCAFVFISGNSNKELIQSINEFSPNGFIGKPISPSSLQIATDIAYHRFKEGNENKEQAIDLMQEFGKRDQEYLMESFIHDLNNPLTVLGMSLKMSKDLEEKVKDKLTKQVSTIQNIVNSFRKINQNELLPKNINITELTEKIELLNKYFCSSKGVQLSINTLDQEINVIEADTLRIITNLIKNAVDAIYQADAERGSLWIKVDFTAEAGGEDVLCTVTDSGHGIPPEVVEKMFDKNFTTKGLKGGTGLGLFLAKQTLKKQNHDIDYVPESENTQFKITFRK